MSDKVSIMSPAFLKANALRNSKLQDYGSLRDYFPFGDKSYTQMIHVKAKRLVNLAYHTNEPNHESIKDSLLDLINYASYYYEWLEDDNE